MNYKIFSILLSLAIFESCSNPISKDNSPNFDSEEQVAPPPPPDASEYTLFIEKSSHWFYDEARVNFYDLENNRVRIQ